MLTLIIMVMLVIQLVTFPLVWLAKGVAEGLECAWIKLDDAIGRCSAKPINLDEYDD